MPNAWNSSFNENVRQGGDERQRVRDELESRLTKGGVRLTGSESDSQLVDLSNALEAFDMTRSRLGVDSMVNTQESSRPDDERFVVPIRRDDESVDRYLVRFRAATEALRAAPPR